MKKITKNLLPLIILFSLVTIISCGEDNTEILVMEDDIYDARINNFATDSLTAEVFLTDVTDGKVDVLLSFSSANDMRRLYITKNIQGQGEEKVDAKDEFGVNDKGDGSIDLAADAKNGFAFALSFNTTSLPDVGTVVYNFWATENKGDFRDSSKDKVEGVATLTINLSGENPAAMLQSYTGIKLEAPTGDATSETFASTLDGRVYKISEGEEFASFWDFGFYFLNTPGVSLSSTVEYPNLFSNPDTSDGLPLVSVNTFLGIAETEVNNMYFVKAEGTVDFDSFSTSGDLSSVSISSTNAEKVNNLAIDDVVYVLDQYGKKGVLKVTGLKGTFNSDGFVQFDLKMQQ